MVLAPVTLAEEALRLVGVDPAKAAVAAEQAVAAARQANDRGAESTAHRAWGLAAAALQEPEQAVAHLRRAVRCAGRADLAKHAAAARMSLAFALLGRGQIGAALDAARRASEALTGLDAARLEAQRATILVGAGRLDEALKGFRRALPVVRRAGDELWEARILNNRGVLHARRDAFAAAERDLRRAEAIYGRLALPQLAAGARWNLGYAAARYGDVPGALAHYDEVEIQRGSDGLPTPALHRDRAELLLAAGLLDEARVEVTRAVVELARRGLASELAEARLTAAQVMLAIGDVDAATEHAEEALRSFTAQHRHAFAALARHARLQASTAAPATPGRLAEAEETAGALRAAGLLGAALDAQLIAGRTALRLQRLPDADVHFAAAASARVRGPVQLRVRAWHAEALRRLAQGRPRAAESALRASLRIVDEYRASFGATELRAGASTHAREVARLGVRIAADRDDADAVLRWAERWRAAALRLPPVRPAAGDVLADALARLRALSRDIDEALLAGTPTTALRHRQTAVEHEVRRLIRQARGSSDGVRAELPSIGALAMALGDRVLVEYVRHGEELLAVVVTGGVRRARLARLPGRAAIAATLESLRFAGRRLVTGYGAPASVAAALHSARRCAQDLDDLVLAPLRHWLGDRELVVVPTGLLHSVPWGALPSRIGLATAVAPSAASWLRGAVQPRHSGGKWLFVAGPGLPAAQQETGQLAARYADASVLAGPVATVEQVVRALRTARWAHVACHARYRADNPLFSHLQLADGPLTVYDLESAERTPELVVLSACQSGVASIRAGDEVLGLAAALLPRGTRTLVATLAPVADEAALALMSALHDGLRSGQPPATALALAQRRLAEAGPVQLATAAAYVCVGYG